jgi:hypothetical protein
MEVWSSLTGSCDEETENDLLNPICMNTIPESYIYTRMYTIHNNTPGGNHTYMTQDLTLKQMQNETRS